MELWIRSQDKKLLCKCDSLFIAEEAYKRKGKYKIMANNGWLGEYNKLEKALEILDEIQHLIQPKLNFIVSQHIDFDNDGEGLIGCNILKEEPKIEKISDCIVYEMPEE